MGTKKPTASTVNAARTTVLVASPRSAVHTVRHNFPAETTRLIGRENDIQRVSRLVLEPGVRLVTLSGPGGSGKTRLALAVAAAVLGEFQDGIWLVELAPLGNPTLVPAAVAASLGVREQPGRAPHETLLEAFRGRSILLVLDNCEHLVDACAEFVDQLLRSCPDLRILATSREPLRITGERTWRVSMLPAPDLHILSTLDESASYPAVQLFVERARAVEPRFELTQQNSAAVAGICARVDGLPLAIELAAAGVRVLAPEDILGRLDDAMGLLVGGNRVAPTRQQTLRAALDWSYSLLAPNEQRLFQRLSVFAGLFDLEAMQVICGHANGARADLLELLTRLVDKSLVVVDEQPDRTARYRLLETVRQYAQQRSVESGAWETTRQTHAAYCVALAERAAPALLGPDQGLWLDRLDDERDNCRLAHDWLVIRGDVQSAQRLAGKLWPFWLHRGYWAEGKQHLMRVLALPNADARSAGRASVLLGAGHLAEAQGDFVAARALFLEARELQREGGDSVGLARSLVRLGALANLSGEPATARQLLDEATALTRLTGERATEVSALIGLVNISLAEGDLAAAKTLSALALATARAIGWPFGIARALKTLGWVLAMQGDGPGARTAYEESLREFRLLQDRFATAGVLNVLGSMAVTEGNYSLAHATLSEGLALQRDLGDREGASWGLLAFAGLLVAVGQSALALRLAGSATALRTSLAALLTPGEEAAVTRWLARAHGDLGQRAAEDAWEQGCALRVELAIEMALATSVGIEQPPNSTPPLGRRTDALTRREREVALLVVRGLSNKQIASELVISERTADGHVANILSKLSLSSRVQVAVWAVEHPFS